jgi:predicted PurR-regulated permease PerM
VEAARDNAAHALGYLAVLGHLLLQALIGFILAVVFTLEDHELRGFARGLDPRSLAGTLLRWLGHVADAISVTLQFQLIVAACNAALTLPVLILVGIPHVGAFAFMVFVSGMVPVVGNFLSGAVLTLLAYQSRGFVGVAVFVCLTFVLHKLESYYLNPRLAARHVRLPGFVLIVSLILWEHLAGFVGLFLSFPFLYLCMRIRAEFAEEDGVEEQTAAAA